jgi:hypothetical protein
MSCLSKARPYDGVQDIVHIVSQTVEGQSQKKPRYPQERNGDPPEDEDEDAITHQGKSPQVEELLARVVLC